MRVATLIIGLILFFVVLIQSLLIATGEAILGEEESKGAVGVLVAVGYLIASALVLAKPRFAMWTFAVTAAIGILAGLTTDFSDLLVWGIVAIVLALMSWRGSIEKRGKDAEERAGRDALVTLAAQKKQESTPGLSPSYSVGVRDVP